METLHQLETTIENYEKTIFEQQQSLKELKDEVEKLKLQAELEKREQAKTEGRKPKKHKKYWLISTEGSVEYSIWTDREFDDQLLAIGNVFSTEEEGEFEVERRKVITELSKYATDFVKCAKNWTIYWSHPDGEMAFDFQDFAQYHELYFASKEIALQAVEAVGADRVKKFYLGVK